MAIHLMDEQNEQSGETSTVDTQEYKFRTISILNSVIPALAPYSEKPWKDRTAAILYAKDYKNPRFNQDIPLDDTLCYAVLPYYLAAQLLSGENEELAAWFMSRYREVFLDLRSKVPAEFESIQPVYGLF
jgi:hypothetical protein